MSSLYTVIRWLVVAWVTLESAWLVDPTGIGRKVLYAEDNHPRGTYILILVHLSCSAFVFPLYDLVSPYSLAVSVLICTLIATGTAVTARAVSFGQNWPNNIKPAAIVLGVLTYMAGLVIHVVGI